MSAALDEDSQAPTPESRDYAVPATIPPAEKWTNRAAAVVVALVFLLGFLSHGYATDEHLRGVAWFLCSLLGCWGVVGMARGRWSGPYVRPLLWMFVLGIVPLAWWGAMLVPVPSGLAASLSPAWSQAQKDFAAVGLELPARVPLAASPVLGAASWHQLLASLLFFAGVCNLAIRRSGAKHLVVILCVALLAETLLGFADWLADGGRANGAIFSPTHHAAFLAMLLPPYFAALIVWSRTSRSLGGDIAGGANPLLLLFGVGGLAVLNWLLALSRGSLLFGGAALAIWATVELFGRSREFDFRGNARLLSRNLMIGGIVAVVAVMAFVLLADSTDIVEGYRNRDDEAVLRIRDQGRVDFWKSTLKGLREAPLLGLGPSGARRALDRFATQSTEKAPVWSHNDYVQGFAELGVPVGLTALAAGGMLLASLWGDLRRRRRAFDWSERILQRAALAGIVATLTHSSVDFPLRVPLVGFGFLTLVAIFLCPGSLFITSWIKRRT